MLFYTRCLFKSQTKKLTDSRWWLGLMLVITLASISIALSKLSVLQNAQVSSLTIGIILGIIVGNSLFSRIATHTDIGVDYAKSFLLKAGIILFGFRITFSQITEIGWLGLVIDLAILLGTFILAIQLGKR
ncbi:MAG: putative sulfate exporter family transporter, partial [Pseudomonadota bacterium]